MAAEAGHAASRVYTDQAGAFHENGASIFDAAEVARTATATELNQLHLYTVPATPVNGIAAGYKVARGRATTVTASDTVVTGLATVVSVVASLDDDPVATCDRATATIGNQAGAPAAGSILVKTWMPTAAGNTAPAAASTFGKIVAWVAVGT